MKACAPFAVVRVLLLVASLFLVTSCGSGGGSSPAPAPPPNTTPPTSPSSPQAPASPGPTDNPTAPTSPQPPGIPGSPTGNPAPAPGRTLWSYGAGAPQEGGEVTAAVDVSGAIVVGFHEGTGPFVFTLRKVGADGKQLWSRTMGAPGCDTSGRVLGVAPGGTIVIDLASGCDLPGFGPFAKGEGARFALDADGQFLRAVHGGRDPSVVTSDGSIVTMALLAPPTILLFAYGADGAARWSRPGEYAVVMRPTDDGGFIVAANRPPAVYSDRPPHLSRYRSDGSLAWSRDFPAGFVVEDAAVLDDGTTALAGFATSSVTWAGHEVGGAFGTPTLLTVDAAGQPRSARTLEDGNPAITGLPGGAIAVVTRGGCDHLWAYDASLQRLWERVLDASCRTRTFGLSGVPASQLTGFGIYTGTIDLGEGHTTTAPGPQDAFLAAFAP